MKRKRYKLSAAHRAKISATIKGTHATADSRAAISTAMKGLPFTAKHCRNLSRAHKKRYRDTQPEPLRPLTLRQLRSEGRGLRGYPMPLTPVELERREWVLRNIFDD